MGNFSLTLPIISYGNFTIKYLYIITCLVEFP